MCAQVVGHVEVVETDMFEGVVGRELRARHEHGACRVRPDAAEYRGGTFFADHAHEAVEGMFIVALLFGRQSGVRLHAHVQDVAGIAREAAEEARGGGHKDEVEEGMLGFRVRRGRGWSEARFEVFIYAKAHGGIGQLA